MSKVGMSDQLSYLDDFSDNPFWTVAAGRDHKLIVYPKTGVTEKNDKGWKVLFMEVELGEHPEKKKTEIPFWIRTDIIRAIKNQPSVPDSLELRFFRVDTVKEDKTIRTGTIQTVLSQ